MALRSSLSDWPAADGDLLPHSGAAAASAVGAGMTRHQQVASEA